MLIDNSTPINNYHVEYMEVTQHWHSQSEPYAGGDALVTMLAEGWKISRDVHVEDRFFAGLRSVSVYHLELERDGHKVKMPVIRNPYINRVIREGDFRLVPFKKDE